MAKNSRKISRREGCLVVLTVLALGGLAGCHDWPDERVTAIEAQNILRDLSRIETIPDPNMPRPEIYQSPPKKLKQVVGGEEEWKLIYFCRYHTAVEMRQIIHDQFAVKVFDEKGQSKVLPGYTVSANPATNQLIVRCPKEADIDAVLEVIHEADIPPIQVRIDCMVSELYADLTMDRETTLQIENLFGEGIALGGKEATDSRGVPTGQFLPAFPGAALRDPARARFGLKVGIKRDNFQALVDLLVSRGYLKILMNPQLEVVNGQMAKIQSKQHVPLQQIVLRYGSTADALFETKTEYYDVIDSLEITPHVFADGYIGLQTTAQIAAYLTPEGIKQTPIVTERVITNKQNRIRLGESLIIGGIRKSEKRDVVRGVPILKDIPGLNLLFSGRDFEERATEVIFILTPSISTGGRPNRDMVDVLKDRHSSPMTQGLHERVLDPLGTKARREEEDRRDQIFRPTPQESEAGPAADPPPAIPMGPQNQDAGAEFEPDKANTAPPTDPEAQGTAVEAQETRTELPKAKEKPPKPPEPSQAAAPKEPRTPPPGGTTDSQMQRQK
jgi:Flp pilus assembly secretin CpaC